jgi:hypothetical protein
MKQNLLLLFIFLLSSCTAEKHLCPAYRADDLVITKKYIGNYIDYRHTGPEICGGTDLIWIKTTMTDSFGKISAFGKTCNFRTGDKIYLNSTYSAIRKTGDWEYEIGNDSAVLYRVSEFQYQNKNFIAAWQQ